MKLHKIALITLAALAAGCQSSEEMEIKPDYANVELSSESVVVDPESQMKTLFVSSNRKEWSVEEACGWLDVNIDGNAITLFIDENTSAEGRLGVVEIVAGEQPDVAKARLKVYQEGKSTANLSAEATANCYIAPTGGSYRFDAQVKGNGKGDGNSRYIELEGVEIEGATYAELAWESTFDGDKTRSTKIILNEPVYSAEQKAIFFTTGECEGNALITLHNAAGKILWSWHIWVVNERIGSTSIAGIDWMDRNLGALNNTPGDVNNRGLLYQWGRKEPFLPSTKPYDKVPTHKYDAEGNLLESEEEYYATENAIVAARERLNVNNEQVGNGSQEWQYAGYIAPVALSAPGNIDYALNHPTSFLGCRVDIPIGEYVFDWYLQQDLEGKGSVMQQSDSYLWGDSRTTDNYKTIFDPCPVGYVVPPTGAFGEIPAGYACTYGDRDWSMGDYGWDWNVGEGLHFPRVGNFDVSGLIGETSERILYWTAESFGSNYEGFGKAAMLFEAFDEIFYGIYPILDPAEMAAWYSYGAKCIGASVRCVKE